MSGKPNSNFRCSNQGSVDRRAFIRTVAGASALVGLGGRGMSSGLFAAPTPQSAAETAVVELYKTMSAEQQKLICLPFGHELQNRINANWHITKPQLGEDFFTKSQRDLVKEIVRGVTSEDGYGRLQKQMDYDSGGLDFYSIAIFGKPGDGKFEFELTGRHLTLRADGNSVDHAAFGGPIVYGHGEEDPGKNLFHYQTQQTNEVFKSLSTEQSAQALLEKAPAESAVQIQGKDGQFPGINVGSLSSDQQALVENTLAVLLAPYRAEDIQEAMQILKDSGGVQKLNMAFYRQGDLNNDKQWDIWRVEGPSFVWHFRGAPHVHAYINIGHVKA